VSLSAAVLLALCRERRRVWAQLSSKEGHDLIWQLQQSGAGLDRPPQPHQAQHLLRVAHWATSCLQAFEEAGDGTTTVHGLCRCITVSTLATPREHPLRHMQLSCSLPGSFQLMPRPPVSYIRCQPTSAGLSRYAGPAATTRSRPSASRSILIGAEEAPAGYIVVLDRALGSSFRWIQLLGASGIAFYSRV
jgi:hypothetical protein